VGCVNTTLRSSATGGARPHQLPQAQCGAAAEIEEAVSVFSRDRWHEAFGASGTIGAAAELIRQVDWATAA